MMHSSVGSGALAYVVGSKVMDMRTLSKDNGRKEPKVESRQASVDNSVNLEYYCVWNNDFTDLPYASPREHSSDSADLVSVRQSTESAVDNCSIPSSSHYSGCSSQEREADGSCYLSESFFDFPPTPVSDLFENSGEYKTESHMHDDKLSAQCKLKFEDDTLHSFQISDNVDVVIKSNDSLSTVSLPINSEIDEVAPPDVYESGWLSNNVSNKREIVHKLKIPDGPETPLINLTTSQGEAVSEGRVSEWLWTLHQIVVDVVRTDIHLEFDENTKNLARMSDILAVYAWVDPATGTSDLLSPFVVLFEDDANAFWCFEMILRRMRENFQMEGPTGVMKQLQALWRILKITDREMFAHLSHIGAESFHFAFRMLLVLFRRELSFSEALCMWEMMWAVDFDETLACNSGEHRLEGLTIQLPRDSGSEVGEKNSEVDYANSKEATHQKHRNVECSISDNSGMRSTSTHHFCGLTRSFRSRSDHMQIDTRISSTRNVDDELSVFCVAEILILIRQKIIRETHSIEDMIKIFNDNMLKINVKRCVRTAIKLRKKYFYKLIKSKSIATWNGE